MPDETKRETVRNMLAQYVERYPIEKDMVERVLALVRDNDDFLLRTCVPGHITGSAWIVSHDHSHALLTHHRKLDRWLQLGGHADGEPEIQKVALREAREESGMQDFSIVMSDGKLVPLDVDVHDIPAYGDEPAHEHHDLRFLLIASKGQELRRSEESKDLRWFTLEEIPEVSQEESLLRMLRKSEELLKTVHP